MPLEKTTDDGGRFQIDQTAVPAKVIAWKEGYFIGSALSDSEPITIYLRRLPTEDNPDYRWVDPESQAESFSCGTCHQAIHDEWRKSAHGKPAESSRFRDLFPDLERSKPDGTEVCASCHNPAPLERAERHFGNVHCDFCHKVRGPAAGEIGLIHGKYGLELLRPKTGQLIFGPLEDAARLENTFSPFQKSSRLCASCHEGVVFGVRVYETYSEWQASPAAKAGKQCQDCHMKPTGEMTNMAPGHGGVERDPHTLGNHRFFAGSHEAMLKNCLRLALDLSRRGDTVQAAVEVRAEDVGHRVPTGLPDRNLTLLVEAFDGGGKRIGAQSKVFAKKLKDFDGRGPVPFWRAAPEFDDTRLTPGQPERFEFDFPAGAARVTAKLVYRKFWPQMLRDKGWPDDAWVVAEVTR